MARRLAEPPGRTGVELGPLSPCPFSIALLLLGPERMEVSSLDAASFAAGRLTPEQAEQFSRDGYLVVPDAIPAEDLAVLHRLMAEMIETVRVEQQRWPDEDVRQALFSRNHRLQEHPALLRLLTAKQVFPKIVDILGSNISLFHAFSPCTKPAGPAVPPPPNFDSLPQFGFHRDGGLHPNRLSLSPSLPLRPLSLSFSLSFSFSLSLSLSLSLCVCVRACVALCMWTRVRVLHQFMLYEQVMGGGWSFLSVRPPG